MSLLFLGSPVVLFGILAFVSGQEQQLLMVFGGRGCEAIQGCPYANNVTLISLDGGPSVPDCLNNLGPPPKRLYSACQATLGEGKLRVNFVKSFVSSSQQFCQNRQAPSRLRSQILWMWRSWDLQQFRKRRMLPLWRRWNTDTKTEFCKNAKYWLLNRGSQKSQDRQYLDFGCFWGYISSIWGSTLTLRAVFIALLPASLRGHCPIFCSSLAYESAVQQPKHCLTWGFSQPLLVNPQILIPGKSQGWWVKPRMTVWPVLSTASRRW